MKRQDRSTTILLGAIGVMGVLVSLLLVADEQRLRTRRQSASSFQKLVGGLGLGPATDWSRCAHSFDQRVSSECYYNAGPVPGGADFCPYHASSVLFMARHPRRPTTTASEEHANHP